ncbi:MAG: hypothetical protein GWN31_13055, partial [Candidatus Thorarchaeota archaeon]|nr:hypothetical protein [Candidatus Thorarchaeota archaeon]NIW52875.1 hypothetical protein [Candidatus Korarchaeota archaeon]
ADATRLTLLVDASNVSAVTWRSSPRMGTGGATDVTRSRLGKMAVRDLTYIRICQKCNEVNSYGKGHGYYKCGHCGQMTISIVSSLEYVKESDKSES